MKNVTDNGLHEGLSDSTLVNRAKNGNADAFHVLVCRYYGMVFTIGYSGLKCREAADDLAQEVFLRLFINLSRLQHPEYFSTWATRVARNLTTDWLRSQRRTSRLIQLVPLEDNAMQVPAPGCQPREQCEEEQFQRQLQKVMDELPRAQREVLLLHYSENMTQQEIAKQLEIHHTTVGRLLRKSVETIRTRLGQWSGEPINFITSESKSRAVARSTALIIATTQLSLECHRSLAAAAASSANLVPASAANVSHVVNLSTFTKGIVMFTKSHKIIFGVSTACALATAYHFSHPGEFKQMMISALDRSSKDHTFVSSIAQFTPELAAGEELFHGAIGPVESCVLHLKPEKGDGVSASFDVPVMGICQYPLLLTGSPETGMRLVATGQIDMTLRREGREVTGEARYSYKGDPSTTSPVRLTQIAEPLPIQRQMPRASKEDFPLNEYTGWYATGGDSVFEVSVKDGQLYAQNSGQDPLAIYPIEKDRFFYRSIPAEVQFGRGADNKINRMTFRQRGKNLPGRRLVP